MGYASDTEPLSKTDTEIAAIAVVNTYILGDRLKAPAIKELAFSSIGDFETGPKPATFGNTVQFCDIVQVA
jgi:hypothetical protein